jgi:hypothetical protein
MSPFKSSIAFVYRPFLALVVAGLLFINPLSSGAAVAEPACTPIPADTMPALHYLFDLAADSDAAAFDARRIEPLMSFFLSSKTTDAIYRADSSFKAPSAYHEFSVNTDLHHMIDYIMDTDIPSYFFWPSSLRLTRWTHVEGGDTQFDRLKSAFDDQEAPFILKGSEYVTITPDQHTGAYYSYDVDKMVLLTPFNEGKALISIYRQQKTSEVGRKGWVLGSDDDWSYLYTQQTGLNIGGLGWASTYMYDSFGITVYYQPDMDQPMVNCGVFSWVKAGWARMNMVQSKHIHRGLVRVSTAFKAIMEDPRLPEPATLAQTFSNAKQLSTATLKAYAKDYFDSLEQRLADFESLRQKVGEALNADIALAEMTRDELYAVVALDYFKKLLGRNPVMENHPF